MQDEYQLGACYCNRLTNVLEAWALRWYDSGDRDTTTWSVRSTVEVPGDVKAETLQSSECPLLKKI
jgi:hypothetical protein